MSRKGQGGVPSHAADVRYVVGDFGFIVVGLVEHSSQCLFPLLLEFIIEPALPIFLSTFLLLFSCPLAADKLGSFAFKSLEDDVKFFGDGMWVNFKTFLLLSNRLPQNAILILWRFIFIFTAGLNVLEHFINGSETVALRLMR